MSVSSAEGSSRRWPRVLGLLLLLLAAAWGAVLARQFQTSPAAPPAATPIVTGVPTAMPTEPQPAAAEPTPIGRATPWSVVGMGVPQTTPTAVPPTPTVIRPLITLGPPTDSRFRLDDRVTFYWTWSEPLTADQQFALYVESDAGRALVGVIDEANLGTAFQLTAALADIAAAGQYRWLVRLEDTGSQVVIAESLPRIIHLSDG